jgi:hypothetical protein
MTESTTGAPGKGGSSPYYGNDMGFFGEYVYGRENPQENVPVYTEPTTAETAADIDTGSGYYRNPYASGYGMGYQNPMMSAYSPAKGGSRYAPRYGMLGPTGFGAYGAYSPFDTYNPYASTYNPYAGMSPFVGKGGYSPTTGQSDDPAPDNVASPDDFVEPVVETPVYEVYPDVETGVQTSPDTAVEPTNIVDVADADPTQTVEGAAIAADGSNVVDFTPYAGDEYVRIGDQVVSRAELQRRGSDYYTRPAQQPPRRRQQYPMYGGKGGYYR